MSKWRWFRSPMPEQMPSTSNLVAHAQRELTLAGLFDEDGDYNGDIGDDVLELVKVLARQRHSGGEHNMVMAVFNEVANFKALTPITDDPDEWMDIDGEGLWQNRRQSSVFSTDGGKTYYDIEERMAGEDQPIHKSEEYTRG